ncbi:MAG: hypothetical protein ACYSR1_10360, partial [Planctomycetota bacterium]
QSIMRRGQKEKIYGYAFKAVLSLILLFCLYNAVCIIFLSRYGVGKLRSRVSSTANAVESIIKHAGPKETENIIYKSNLVNKTNDSSWANRIKRATLFAGPTKIRTEKMEEEIVQFEEVEVAENTETIFKGVVDDLAYIVIRKEMDGQWREHGFQTKIGEKIGGKMIVGGKMLDFTTNYVLQDIAYNAQRPTTLMKKLLILNEKGGFVGTRMVPGDTYMKSTSKIKYRDENGITRELWLGEGEERAAIENLTKP